uniref:SRRM_C domain-containing protein n=1 Tax=Mesocestoides corti TaxID=53468 RepID=A0A5K3FLA3_MESCO
MLNKKPHCRIGLRAKHEINILALILSFT